MLNSLHEGTPRWVAQTRGTCVASEGTAASFDARLPLARDTQASTASYASKRPAL